MFSFFLFFLLSFIAPLFVFLLYCLFYFILLFLFFLFSSIFFLFLLDCFLLCFVCFSSSLFYTSFTFFSSVLSPSFWLIIYFLFFPSSLFQFLSLLSFSAYSLFSSVAFNHSFNQILFYKINSFFPFTFFNNKKKSLQNVSADFQVFPSMPSKDRQYIFHLAVLIFSDK